MLNERELTDIRRRERLTRSGPWRAVGRAVHYTEELYPGVAAAGFMVDDMGTARFIAHSRTDVKRLLEHVDHLESLLRDLSVLDQDGAYQRGYQDGMRHPNHRGLPPEK